jgi:hypothetical protein
MSLLVARHSSCSADAFMSPRPVDTALPLPSPPPEEEEEEEEEEASGVLASCLQMNLRRFSRRASDVPLKWNTRLT